MSKYIRCRNCGKYITTEEALPGGYCSDECTIKFERCINCGRYFIKGKGYTEGYCSKECSIRYELHNVFEERRFGQMSLGISEKEKKYRYVAEQGTEKKSA